MEVIESRLDRANEEAIAMVGYDYILVNDDLEQCVDDLHHVIQSEKSATGRNREFISQITEELKMFLKGEE